MAKKASRAPQPPIDLPRFIPYQISVLHALVGRTVGRAYRADLALSGPEWKVLSIVAYRGAIASGDIRAYVTLDRVGVSRAVAKLLAMGLVSRASHADQRMFRLELTPEGETRYRKLARAAVKAEKELLAGLGPEEVEALHRLLRKLQLRFAAGEPAHASDLIPMRQTFPDDAPVARRSRKPRPA